MRADVTQQRLEQRAHDAAEDDGSAQPGAVCKAAARRLQYSDKVLLSHFM